MLFIFNRLLFKSLFRKKMFKSSTVLLGSILNSKTPIPVFSVNSYSIVNKNLFTYKKSSLVLLNNKDSRKNFLIKNSYSTESKKR